MNLAYITYSGNTLEKDILKVRNVLRWMGRVASSAKDNKMLLTFLISGFSPSKTFMTEVNLALF